MVKKELGLIFGLESETGALEPAALKAMTREQADSYVKNRLSQLELTKTRYQGSLTSTYWAPLSAFQPLESTGAEPLTELMVNPPLEKEKDSDE